MKVFMVGVCWSVPVDFEGGDTSKTISRLIGAAARETRRMTWSQQLNALEGCE
jgi:hypothetical protein